MADEPRDLDSLPAHWDEMAATISGFGDTGEGGAIANQRVAATLRTCASQYRAIKARDAAHVD